MSSTTSISAVVQFLLDRYPDCLSVKNLDQAQTLENGSEKYEKVQLETNENSTEDTVRFVRYLFSPKHISSQNQKRIQSLKGMLCKGDLSKEEDEVLVQICEDNYDIFYLPGDKLSSTYRVLHIPY